MNLITRRRAMQGGGAVLPAAWLMSGTNVALARILERPSAGEARNQEFWRLVRELLARSKDFARLESIYDSSDAAPDIYYDAYQGIVETAKCIHWSEQPVTHDAEILEWVSSIYPDDISWVLRREPPIHGLSEGFAKLDQAFEDALRGLSEWSPWPINPLHQQHEQWADAVKAQRKFARTSDALRESRALTPGDHMLKRRAIEHMHCGLGGKIAKAKYAYGFGIPPPRTHLALAIELNRARGFTGLRCRTDWRQWQWIYA
jgi:hypothetical protein